MTSTIRLILTTRKGIAATIQRNGFISDASLQAIEQATANKLCHMFPATCRLDSVRLALIANRCCISALELCGV